VDSFKAAMGFLLKSYFLTLWAYYMLQGVTLHV
jgi:hypothetical protein